MNEAEYNKDLARRQKEHLERIRNGGRAWEPCLHDQCQICHGTGVSINGGACIHGIACACPKCTPSYTLLLDPTSGTGTSLGINTSSISGDNVFTETSHTHPNGKICGQMCLCTGECKTK